MNYQIKPLAGNVTAPELMELAKEMLAESRFARLGADRDKLFFHVSDILTRESWIAFGLFHGDNLCGMAIGLCGEILPFTASRVATEHYLYLQPRHRGAAGAAWLVNSFVAEARRRGARDIVLSNGFGGDPDKVGKLFESCGATRIGGIYSFGD